jgi:hypothetical protein
LTVTWRLAVLISWGCDRGTEFVAAPSAARFAVSIAANAAGDCAASFRAMGIEADSPAVIEEGEGAEAQLTNTALPIKALSHKAKLKRGRFIGFIRGIAGNVIR